MTTLVPIGAFSRLTHLTVKTLRYYHEVGLLTPEQIDPQTSYRRYATDQVGDALLIGRLRSLEMPLAEVQQVVTEPGRRDALISEHLRRMEAELDRTRGVVSSLRALLQTPPRATEISLRTSPDLYAVVHTERVAMDDIAGWCERTYEQLGADVARRRLTISGPAGALYGEEFFNHDVGEVTAYLPVTERQGDTVTIQGGRFAVATHHGSFLDLDQTYAALGSVVTERHQTAPGPTRELYLVSPDEVDDDRQLRAEVWWPITG